MSIVEISAAAGTVGAFLLSILVYLMRISGSLGKIIDKVDHCEARLDSLEQLFRDAQLTLTERVTRVEATLFSPRPGRKE